MTIANKKNNIEIIMLSRYGREDGGRETWLYNFLPELLKNKSINKVTLFGINTNDSDNIKELLKIDNNKIVPVLFNIKKSRLPLFISMFFKLKKHKYEIKKDITLAMGIFELIMMVYIKQFKKTKKIVWLRSIFSNEKAYAIPRYLKKPLLKFETYLLKKTDIIIANGDDIKLFYENLGVKNINVIKNGVDIKKWDLEPPKIKKQINIAYIGRLSKVKGIESYLRLIEIIKTSNYANDFIFHTVGSESTYKEKVNELVNKNWLINHGLKSNKDLPVFLKKIEVCVALTFASNNLGGGGTSNAMLEQIAASRIMLAWDNEIFRQYLNEDNSFLVTQYSTEQLKQTLIKIKQNPANAINKAKKAKEMIKPYTFSQNCDSFTDLI